MTAQISKKYFNLKGYGRLFGTGGLPAVFFFSRFGKLQNSSLVGGRAFLRSLNVSLARKMIKNTIFSGSSYVLYFPALSECSDINKGLLDSLLEFQQFYTSRKGFLLQNVSIGPFIIDYALFGNLFDGLRLFLLRYRAGVPPEFSVVSYFLLSVFIPSLVRFGTFFLRLLFAVQLNFFNSLLFVKKISQKKTYR